MERGRELTRKRPRTCMGCGEESPKREMVRVVRQPDGTIRVDRSGKAPGRGAYVCSDSECVAKAKKKDTLSRALKAKVPAEIYAVLEQIAAETARDAGEGDKQA